MPQTSRPRLERSRSNREHVLDAATRLLRAENGAAFSMRELAAEARVSFATPFNQFGSKAGIMQALSARLIDRMGQRFGTASPDDDAFDRTLTAIEIAVDVLLEEAEVNRSVIGALGAASGSPGAVGAHSTALWSRALGAFAGLDPALVEIARRQLPRQLAISFRGCLSFWAADELSDAQLPESARTTAVIAMACFAAPARRRALLLGLPGRAPADDRPAPPDGRGTRNRPAEEGRE